MTRDWCRKRIVETVCGDCAPSHEYECGKCLWCGKDEDRSCGIPVK